MRSWLKPVTRRDPWHARWGSSDAVAQSVEQTLVKVTRADRTLVGAVPAAMEWTRVLDGPDRLDSMRIPRWFLAQNGMRVSRPELKKFGWCVKHDGIWFTLDRISDKSSGDVTFTGLSVDASELSRLFSSTSVNPFLRIAQTPTNIMTDLLAGTGTVTLANPGFEEEYDDGYSYNRFSDWYTGWADSPLELRLPNHMDQGAYAFPNGAGYYRMRFWDGNPVATPTWFYLYPAQFCGAAPSSKFRFSAEFHLETPASWAAAVAAGMTLTMQFWWYAPDQATVLGVDSYAMAKPDEAGFVRQRFPSATTWCEAKSQLMRPVIVVYAPTHGYVGVGHGYFHIDNCEFIGENLAGAVPSGWTYDGDMDTRDPDILHTDPDWIEFGTWTTGSSDISSTVVGNQLTHIITGDECTVHFAAGGSGAKCDIELDGVVVAADHDVSAAGTYAITSLDITREHIVSVKVKAVKTAVIKYVVDAANLITVNWSDMSVDECTDQLVSAVGGEVNPDTETRIIHHPLALGRDLRESNILELRRGKDLLRCDIDARRDEVCNRLLYLGYGEGSTRLRILVDASDVDSDGYTSQQLYGVQTRKYENPDCQDWYLGWLEAKRVVAQWQWTAASYSCECTDAAAALMIPGDTVRIYWDEDPDDIIDEVVRILEITRDNEGGNAELVVGDRVSDLPDFLVATDRKLNALSRSR